MRLVPFDFFMKIHFFIITTFMVSALTASAAPRLVISTPSLVPESQIDLVLDSPVVATSELGKTTANPWLEIQPELPGKLLWKAQNIAQFIPAHAPEIGAIYTFSIPKNREYLDQSSVPAGKFATLASEAFRVITANPPNRGSSDYSPSTSPWLIIFNDELDPAAAVNFISYTSKTGQRVAAHVECASGDRARNYAESYPPWAARFPNAPVTPPAAESPLPHILTVIPVSPLPVGQGWQISVLKGLPNRQTSARTTEASIYEIGDIEPFRVTGITPIQTVNEPRKIRISFNHPLSESLPEDFLTKSIEIHPRPKNLSAIIEDREIELAGNFSGVEKYTLTIKPPLASKIGFNLDGPLTKEVTFGNFKPVLEFPSEDQGQLANGSRKYRMLTLNLESAHLRIKKVSGLDRVRAFQGYRHFTGNGPNEDTISPSAAIPFSLIVGPSMADLEIPLGNPLDTSKIVTLSWDEILPKDERFGTFFIEAAGKTHPDYAGPSAPPTCQAIVQLTDIGLAWKLTPQDALIYAFSCDTGQPLPGVKFQLYGEEAAALQSASTDTSGLATIPRSPALRHLHASLGADSYLTAFDSSLDTVGLWHFPVRFSWNKPTEALRKAYLFTDRSLYRPGETVRMKGIVRTQRGNGIEPAKSNSARVVVVDPTEKEIHTCPVTISENGSFDFTYSLPSGKTGTHLIRLEYPEELAQAEALEDQWEKQEAILASARFELPLRVEEFRRNAFEVGQTVTTPVPGAAHIFVDLIAKYYQGQPVAAAKVKYFSRVTAQNPYPARFRDFLFGNHRTDDWAYWYHYFGYRDEDGPEAQISQLQAEAQLSADGMTTLSVAIPQAEFPSTREVVISSEVTDANHQTLTSTATTTVHPASIYVGVSRIDTLVHAGDALPLKILATDTRGEPFSGTVKITATLTREVNSAVKSRTDSGQTTTQNDVEEELISTTDLTLDPAASAAQGTDFTIIPKSNGRHFLTLRGTDPDGRAFATVTHFYVYGTHEFPWLYEDGLRVKMVAEKKSYKPGETARVLILTPIEGTALVTVEREKILRTFSVQLKADMPVIEIPLTAEDAPNAFVSILIVKGAKESARALKEPQLRLGYCELIVENLRDKLSVNLETPAPSYRPGSVVTLSGDITLADGKPAAGAEVTFYAEDEGTLAVMGYETPKPMDYFYTPRNLDVQSGTSFQAFISEDPEKQYFASKGFFIGGGGDMSKLADLLRKNFDPCATWAPALITDATGKFSHTFTLSDTLTRYRIIAIAHQQAARFGHAESSIVVKKDLMLEPKTPRFAHQSDTFNAQVLVQNASTFTGTWEIKFSTASGPESPCTIPTAATNEIVTLAPGASTTVIFPTRAESTGEAVLTFQATPISLNNADLTPALKHHLSDAVESRFPVQYPMPLLRQTQLINLATPGAKHNLLSQLDANLLNGSGEIELEFSRSPLLEAAGSVDFLLHYSYGCVEQTTSSLIPWLSVTALSPVIPRFAEIPEKKVTAAIQAGADRLLSMQLPDGAFSYWPGGTTSVPWATAYAGMGLMMAAQKGANVPQSAIDSLTKNLIESLRGIANEKSPSTLENHARSLFLLALAGSPQPAYRNVLTDRIAELTPSARYLLAAAIASEDAENALNLATAKSILTSKVPFTLKNDNWMPWSADDAHHLIAWLIVDPKSQEPTKSLDRMFRDRNPYGQWRTTWVNGWSLMAMAAYAASQKLSEETIALTLETTGGIETISLTKEQPTAARSFKLSPDLKLDISANQSAFARLKIASKPKITPIQPVATNGLSIDRIYERILADGSAQILTEPQVGDLIRVSLRVTLPTDSTRYLVIEDPLPSVFETVNTDFKSQRAAAGIRTSEDDWQVSHSELRNDRACFFLDEVAKKGTYTVTYLARCTLAGQATAPPAKVESMYDPENFALSASRVFTSR